jgi:hypothetical protein
MQVKYIGTASSFTTPTRTSAGGETVSAARSEDPVLARISESGFDNSRVAHPRYLPGTRIRTPMPNKRYAARLHGRVREKRTAWAGVSKPILSR